MPKKSENRETEIIEFIKNHPKCTSQEILDGLNLEISVATLRRKLQELVAERNMGVPEYVVTDSGPDHDKDFVAEVRVHGKAVGRGAGKSKREAEQSAAKLAHEHLSSRLNKK